MKSIDVINGVIIYYGNAAGYVRDSKAVVDPMFKNNELAAYLTEKRNLAVEWTNGVYDRLASGAVDSPEANAVRLKSCRVWQLKPDTDIMIRFIGYDDLINSGYGEPDPANYRTVYDGQIDTNDLDQIYTKFSYDYPHGFEGNPLSMSDVVELYDDSGSEFHYVDRFGFRKISFECSGQDRANGMNLSL